MMLNVSLFTINYLSDVDLDELVKVTVNTLPLTEFKLKDYTIFIYEDVVCGKGIILGQVLKDVEETLYLTHVRPTSTIQDAITEIKMYIYKHIAEEK